MPEAAGRAMPSAAHGHRPLRFEDLSGWPSDDHGRALDAFRLTADLIADGAWQPLVAAARTVGPAQARRFFEDAFDPVLIGDPAECLVTGYFEPELTASRAPTPAFPVPLHACPPDLPAEAPWATRAEIEEGDLCAGLEIAWVESVIERFFLQVQGSGRLRFADGSVLRVGYGGRNGHPYRSVGRELVRRGVVAEADISAQAIRRHVAANPEDGLRLLRHNPSYVFFRPLPDLPPEAGPLGTLGRPVTPGRTIAADPAHIPLGAPVWLETSGAAPLRRLTVAQDTGSAIVGAQRADLFIGTGEAAGMTAGAMRDAGRLIVLLPKGRAFEARG